MDWTVHGTGNQFYSFPEHLGCPRGAPILLFGG